jgi:hypothetical protein
MKTEQQQHRMKFVSIGGNLVADLGMASPKLLEVKYKAKSRTEWHA